LKKQKGENRGKKSPKIGNWKKNYPVGIPKFGWRAAGLKPLAAARPSPSHCRAPDTESHREMRLFAVCSRLCVLTFGRALPPRCK